LSAPHQFSFAGRCLREASLSPLGELVKQAGLEPE
jgi:hypothetical protein